MNKKRLLTFEFDNKNAMGMIQQVQCTIGRIRMTLQYLTDRMIELEVHHRRMYGFLGPARIGVRNIIPIKVDVTGYRRRVSISAVPGVN